MVNSLSIEQETIVLHSICQMIDDMVNHAMFKSSESMTDGNILFHEFVHAQLFNVLLVDFLSHPQKDHKIQAMPFGLPRVNPNGTPSDRSYLYYLKLICIDPKLGKIPDLFSKSLDRFSNWLDGDVVLQKVHFSTLDETFDIRINRLKSLSMTGNIGKHNVTRLADVAHKLMAIFEENGHSVTLDDCYIALPEFQEHFHDHAFIYQSSHIVEMLTDLRWGLHEYLLPRLARSSKYSGDHTGERRSVKFVVPDTFKNEFSKGSYRLLMQLVYKKPIVKQFATNASMRDLLS